VQIQATTEIDLEREREELLTRAHGQVFSVRNDYLSYRTWIREETFGSFLSGWWVEHLASETQRFYESWLAGERPILGIFAPPQHGKTWNSEDLLAWCIGKHPNLKYLYAAFAKDLGERTNASIQRSMDSERYPLAFETRLPPPGRSEGGLVRNNTHLSFVDAVGEFRNTTVEGVINGLGFDLMVLDDLIKGRVEARSKRVRDTAWDWLTDDVLTRRSKTCGLIFTTTRWHVDDPAGRMMARFPNMRVVKYPALATADDPDGSVAAGHRSVGEALFPEHKPLDFILDQRSAMTSAGFESLYQQNPTIEGGELFPVEKFEYVDVPTPRAEVRRFVRYWDKAGTHKGGNYTVGTLMAMLKNDQFEVQNVRRGQWSALEREQNILRTCQTDNSEGRVVDTWVEQEPGSGGLESAERTIRMLRGFRAYKDKVTGSKEARAEPYAAQVQGGNVRLVRAKWNKEFVDEHEVFPNGPHNDQVDSAGGSFAKLVSKPVFDYANIHN
jgi:predicted phage terminase large subunit-like protein